MFNKQSRTTDNGWSSSLGIGREANNSSPYKTSACYEMLHRASELNRSQNIGQWRAHYNESKRREIS